jgi:hypothetical protein
MPELLRHRVEKFLSSFSHLQDSQREIFCEELLRYILKIQRKTKTPGAGLLRAIALNFEILDEFMFFKSQYLEVSNYLHTKFWINCLAELKSEPIEDQNEKSDVVWAFSFLDDADKKNLQEKWYIDPDLQVSEINPKTWSTGKDVKRKFNDYIRSKVKPLRFIATYDPGQDIEDLSQDIICEIYRIKNNYGRAFSGKLDQEKNIDPCKDNRLKKYIEASLNNKVMAIKKANTTTSKARISSTKQPLYARRERLKKIIRKCKDEATFSKFSKELEDIEAKLKDSKEDFFLTVTSLTKKKPENEDTVSELGDFVDVKSATEDLGMGKEQPEKKIYEEIFVKELVDEICDPRIKEFIKIVIGDYDDTFEEWASKNKYNLAKFENLVRGAKIYCNVTTGELRNHHKLINNLKNG